MGVGHGQIVYISFDGLLQPLGWAQVAEPLMRLAARGYRYRIISLERAQDLVTVEHVRSTADKLESANIEWDPREYCTAGRPTDPIHNLKRAFSAGQRAIQEGDVSLVHARSYPAALVADAIRTAHGVDYLFDTRGYWIDERKDEGRWFVRPTVYRAAKRLERRLFARCVAAVSLTELATSDIRQGHFGPWPIDKPAVTIPTCADYTAFHLANDKRAERARVAPELADKLLVGYVGSINASYLTHEAFNLFGRVLARRPDAHLICATQQPEQVRAIAKAQGLPASSVTIRAFTHEEMPALLAGLDWGLLLLAERFSKRASMPTKLGEFFASGVRPVAFGCNEELLEWVKRAGTGLILRQIDSQALDEAAEEMAKNQTTRDMLTGARARTAEHFDWARGVERYDALLRALGVPANRSVF